MSIDDPTVIESSEIFGEFFIREEEGRFVVKKEFFKGIPIVNRCNHEGKRLYLFIDSACQACQAYHAYKLPNGNFSVFRKIVPEGGRYSRLMEELKEIEEEYPMDQPVPEKGFIPQTELEERIRDAYDSDGLADKRDWGDTLES